MPAFFRFPSTGNTFALIDRQSIAYVYKIDSAEREDRDAPFSICFVFHEVGDGQSQVPVRWRRWKSLDERDAEFERVAEFLLDG